MLNWHTAWAGRVSQEEDILFISTVTEREEMEPQHLNVKAGGWRKQAKTVSGTLFRKLASSDFVQLQLHIIWSVLHQGGKLAWLPAEDIWRAQRDPSIAVPESTAAGWKATKADTTKTQLWMTFLPAPFKHCKGLTIHYQTLVALRRQIFISKERRTGPPPSAVGRHGWLWNRRHDNWRAGFVSCAIEEWEEKASMALAASSLNLCAALRLARGSARSRLRMKQVSATLYVYRMSIWKESTVDSRCVCRLKRVWLIAAPPTEQVWWSAKRAGGVVGRSEAWGKEQGSCTTVLSIDSYVGQRWRCAGRNRGRDERGRYRSRWQCRWRSQGEAFAQLSQGRIERACLISAYLGHACSSDRFLCYWSNSNRERRTTRKKSKSPWNP